MAKPERKSSEPIDSHKVFCLVPSRAVKIADAIKKRRDSEAVQELDPSALDALNNYFEHVKAQPLLPEDQWSWNR